MTEPKYQWSKFVNGGRDEQFVVRTETFGELVEGMEKIKGLIAKDALIAPVVAPVVAPSVDLSTNATCPVHGTPLVWKAGTSKTTGKPYGFWACPTKNADGSYCKAGGAK